MLELAASLALLWIVGTKMSNNHQLLQAVRAEEAAKSVAPQINPYALLREDFAVDLAKLDPSFNIKQYQDAGLILGNTSTTVGAPLSRPEWNLELNNDMWSNTMQRHIQVQPRL